MTDLAGTPPPQRVSWVSLVGGWILAALAVAVCVPILRAMYARPQPTVMWPAAAFLVLSLLALVGLGVAPTLRLLRDRAAYARFHQTLPLCPSCGVAKGRDARCASCLHPLDDGEAYWVLSARHWAEPLATSIFGPALVCLGVFFAMLLTHPSPHTTPTVAVVFALFALGLVVGGVAVSWFSIGSVRAALGEPLRFTYTRTWVRERSHWYTWATLLHRDGVPFAEGRTDGLTAEPPMADDHGAGTAFERGLAALLAAWHRSDEAPLTANCSLRWTWSPTRQATDTTRAETAYRDAARDQRDVAGATREIVVWWAVNLNLEPLAELLRDAQLPPLTGDAHDTRIEELLDAEWDVALREVIDVFSRCAPLRDALEARGVELVEDTEVRRALRAIRSPGTPVS